MKTRQLGHSGLEVAVISFGAFPITGAMGPTTEQEALETVRAAVESGMTFIDTAEAYGPGILGGVRHSEEILGKALAGRRHEVILCTKVSGNNSIEHMNQAMENSLRMLATDYVDVYLLHGADQNYPLEKTMEGLLRLKEEGKTRLIGVSSHSTEQVAELLTYGPLDCHMVKYHMLFRANEATMEFSQQHGMGVTTHSTLAKGLLTGKYKPGHTFHESDERCRTGGATGPFQEQGLARCLAVGERLKEWAEARGRTLVQLALAWALVHPSVSAVTVGPKSPQQVREAAAAADWELTKAELDEIDELQGGFELVGNNGYELPPEGRQETGS
jgi:aryl-alcohol dehydrogenase-like predicted oxidoreductase